MRARRRREAPEPPTGPLTRRLIGEHLNLDADSLAVMRTTLAAARRAGYPFEEAWTIGAEAALSYMCESDALEWWDTLTATERAWADAYAKRSSRLADLAHS